MKDALPDRIGDEEVLIGAGAASFSPTVVEAFGGIGLDFAWIDLEHSGISPWDSTAVEELVRAGETADIELVVRIPTGEPALVRKVLDAGVRNIVIPRVEGPAEVERAVRAARFTYEGEPGERGVGLGRVNRWGESVDPDYPAREDQAVSIGVNIEQAAAIENLDEILTVPELGFVFLGHYDLSISMGYTDPSVEPVQAAIATFEETAREAGITFGRSIGPETSEVQARIDAGYDMLLTGNELVAAREIYGELLAAVDHEGQ